MGDRERDSGASNIHGDSRPTERTEQVPGYSSLADAFSAEEWERIQSEADELHDRGTEAWSLPRAPKGTRRTTVQKTRISQPDELGDGSSRSPVSDIDDIQGSGNIHDAGSDLLSFDFGDDNLFTPSDRMVQDNSSEDSGSPGQSGSKGEDKSEGLFSDTDARRNPERGVKRSPNNFGPELLEHDESDQGVVGEQDESPLAGLTREQIFRMFREYLDVPLNTFVSIPENEELEPDPYEDVIWNPAIAQEEALKELFAKERTPRPRARIVLGSCSVCNKPMRLSDITVKRIVFETIKPRIYYGPKRVRTVAWFCPECLIQDLDFRRPPGRGTRHTRFRKPEKEKEYGMLKRKKEQAGKDDAVPET